MLYEFLFCVRFKLVGCLTAQHLLVNAVEMFGPAVDVSDQPVLLHGPLHELADFIDVLLPILVPFRHTDAQCFVDLRLEVLETQILQLILDPPDSKAVRQRRIDLQRLLADLLPLGRAKMFQGAHIV